MGVSLDSDICEERLFELKRPLTKLPRRRAVRGCMEGGVFGRQGVCVGWDVTRDHGLFKGACMCEEMWVKDCGGKSGYS